MEVQIFDPIRSFMVEAKMFDLFDYRSRYQLFSPELHLADVGA